VDEIPILAGRLAAPPPALPRLTGMRVLVTGGAGYIGSHVVAALIARGDDVVVADDLSTGSRARSRRVPILELDLASERAAEILLPQLEGIEAIIHLAARKKIAESVERPAWYYQQNLGSLSSVLIAAREAGIERLVFSSSAAVYASAAEPVEESAVTLPANPYGQTKLAGEWLVAAATDSSPLRATSLRYFNVAGAGEVRLADTAIANLVPMVIERVVGGHPPRIFGGDYPTPDGTAIRDYVHVVDVADAHLAALDGLVHREPGHRVYNIGGGLGSSVREVIEAVARASGRRIEPVIEPRRPGDAASVVASVAAVERDLGWRAKHDLDDIVGSAWRAWHTATAPR
jgi:UDP-glucose 4-epimerase